jgi:threonylcarbamoyladenosine tRNA methylthiotransferase MtaB
VPGFHIENFGCRATRADGEAISDRLRATGLSEQTLDKAGLVVVNTCSVTAEADREARAYIRRARRLNPAARIVVTGCYAQRAPEELARLEGVSVVVGNSHKALAPEIAAALSGNTALDIAGFENERIYTDASGFVTGHDFNRVPDKRSLLVGVASRAASARTNVGALAPAGRLVPLHSFLKASGGAPIFADDRFAHSFLEEAQVVPGSQTRPNLKIQEGCSNRCTFCVIPQTRGPSRSLPAEAVLNQVRGFVAAGGNELVLSGINLGRWGRDLEAAADNPKIPNPGACHPERGRHGDRVEGPAVALRTASSSDSGAPRTLASLVRRIFAETDLPRLRLSSIEPMDWNDELIALTGEFCGTRLARHAHLPLQSGSDAVLRRMHRRYRPWHYAEKVAALLRAAGPELTLGADVMVGFPGETDREFEETLEFIGAQPFGYLHLFPFSPRPATRGWALHAATPVKPGVVAERMAALRALAEAKKRAHRERFIGREVDAITLNTPPGTHARGETSALSENFLPVEISGSIPANRLARVLVMGMNSDQVLTACSLLPDRSVIAPSSCDRIVMAL